VGGAGHQQAEPTADELGVAAENWSLPLFDLDLRKRAVEQDELDEQRRRGEAQFYYDIYGPPDW
jgi:hypothetical protein